MTTVLVTGGTGKTGRPLSAMLRARGATVRVASRHPDPADPDAVRFDWHDPATHRAALAGVDGVYLVPPPLTLDPMPLVGPFLAAVERLGVRRLVLLGSLVVLPNAPGVARLNEAVRRVPDWAVLRPSGFMQNFTGAHPLATRIRDRGEIRTTSGDGRLGWIDAGDIAAVAAETLLERGAGGEHPLTGPEAFGYRDAASIITRITGRPVRVTEIDVDELAGDYRAAGMPSDFAAALAGVDADLRTGAEDRVTGTVRELTGRAPRSFADFVRACHAGSDPSFLDDTKR